MEPITLCGLIIVMFGLWVEFEPAVRAVVRVICKSKLFTEVISHSTVKRPVYVRRMPICVAKGI
jgi:hypothetical protein